MRMSPPKASNTMVRRSARHFLGRTDCGGIGLGLCRGIRRSAGVQANRLPQAIASGLFGMKSFEGGLPTAILGTALEFLITFVATAIYYVVSRKLTFLARRAVRWGLLYGTAIYFFMNLIVVPLSAAPKFDHTVASRASDLIVHMIFIGLPMALAVRRYSAREC